MQTDSSEVKMKTNNSAIIIGAGIGGIATSIYLARQGYEVKVYEKNPNPGGRCGQIIRDGHRFDLGATMLLMPGIYREVFSSLGLDLEESLDLNKLDTAYKLYFDDGIEIALSHDKIKMKEVLESIEKGSFTKYQAYISEGYSFFQLALKKLLGRNFYHLFEFANFNNISLLLKLKIYLKHFSYAGRFFKNRQLKMAFTFQNIYVGQSPYSAPAFFSMIPAAELTEGSYFPNGGIYSIVKTLVSKAEEYGVEFKYNSVVARIDVDNKKATGVILKDGQKVTADIIIANGDLPYVYRELLPHTWKSSYIDNLKYSCSAIVFHWALDKVYPQLGQHSVFLTEDFRAGLDRIFKEHSMSDRPCFYLHAPTRTDPSAAPPGQDSLSVVIGVGHLNKHQDQDWARLVETARNFVIDKLRSIGLEEIEKHIKFEICYNPHTWNNLYNVSRGAVFGSLSHSIMQMGYFRPHNRHNHYRNLYFVGGSTHPGNGIPLVLLSAKLVSERILKENN
jgi:phytoene desaturase